MRSTFINSAISKFGGWRIATAIIAFSFTIFISQINELKNAGIFFTLMVCVSLPLNTFGVGIGKLIAEQNKNLSFGDFVTYSIITIIISLFFAPIIYISFEEKIIFKTLDLYIILISTSIAVINYLTFQYKNAIIKNFPAARTHFIQTTISVSSASLAAMFIDVPSIWLFCFWSTQIISVILIEIKFPSHSSKEKEKYFLKTFRISSFIQFFYTGFTLYLIQFIITNYHRISLGFDTELVAIVHTAITPVTALLIIIDRFFYETSGKKILHKENITLKTHQKIMSIYLIYQLIALLGGLILSIITLLMFFNVNYRDILIITNFNLVCNFCFLILVQYRQTYFNLLKQNNKINKVNFIILLIIVLFLFWSQIEKLKIEYTSLIMTIIILFGYIFERRILKRINITLECIIVLIISIDIIIFLF